LIVIKPFSLCKQGASFRKKSRTSENSSEEIGRNRERLLKESDFGFFYPSIEDSEVLVFFSPSFFSIEEGYRIFVLRPEVSNETGKI
jgi:hypothetical protein